MCLDSASCHRCARPTLLDLRSARSGRSWCLGHRTSLDDRSTHGTWPLSGSGQCRARCCARIHRTRQHAHQPSATLVADALARRLTKHPLPLPCARWLVHIAVLRRITVSVPILAHRRSPHTRSRMHPQPSRTHDHRAGSALLRAPCHMRRSRSPRSASNHSTNAALLFSCRTPHAAPTARGGLAARMAPFLFFRVPTLFLAGRSFFLLGSYCVARHARPHARTLSRARTDDRRTNDATCGAQARLTGSLH